MLTTAALSASYVFWWQEMVFLNQVADPTGQSGLKGLPYGAE